MEGLVIKRHLHHQNYACLPPTTERFTVNGSSPSHRVTFIRKQRSTRIEVPGTVWLNEGHYTENTEAKASPSEYWTCSGEHHASHQSMWMQECYPLYILYFHHNCIYKHITTIRAFFIQLVGTFDPEIAGHFEIKAPLTISYIKVLNSFMFCLLSTWCVLSLF